MFLWRRSSVTYCTPFVWLVIGKLFTVYCLSRGFSLSSTAGDNQNNVQTNKQTNKQTKGNIFEQHKTSFRILQCNKNSYKFPVGECEILTHSNENQTFFFSQNLFFNLRKAKILSQNLCCFFSCFRLHCFLFCFCSLWPLTLIFIQKHKFHFLFCSFIIFVSLIFNVFLSWNVIFYIISAHHSSTFSVF